ncbi:MAG TPA: hypothetical protein RMH99_07690 [Sandaracinaceae bacterium LLY-WYZ-13_1]|nr:hypothetical protein [Sandaracinaceae bacterium LLY-WYZ-13_1]
MMRWTKTTGAALVAASMMLAGCASDVSDSGAPLTRVDRDAMMSQLLYLAPEHAARPLTASELEDRGVDRREAVPVRVEVFEDIAVAWFAPDGEAIIGRDTIVSLWYVVEPENVETIANEVEGGGGYDVTEPPTVDATDYVLDGPVTTTATTTEIEREQLEVTPYDPTRERIIEFFDRVGTPEELLIVEELGGYHPGCL